MYPHTQKNEAAVLMKISESAHFQAYFNHFAMDILDLLEPEDFIIHEFDSVLTV